MPPRWPRKPDPNDPAYRRLENRINFAVHFALFSAVNSGLWFFEQLGHRFEHLETVTLLWFAGLGLHALLALRDRPEENLKPSKGIRDRS